MNVTIFNKFINTAAHVIFQYALYFSFPVLSSCDLYINAEFRAALTACPHETSTHAFHLQLFAVCPFITFLVGTL